MQKNLAIFFDGTWNEPNDRTNVYELYKAAPETSTQETLYIEGVGTQGQGLWAALDKFLGGAFGAGLSANIRHGYQWLCQRQEAGDHIFLFGFSRGAYSARSLAGMVRKCGLLKDPSDDHVAEAYAL
ncbi:MAG: phospholipase effector Tle1 domain-containing protein, partial [Achromobacter piechaudii]